MNKVAMIGNLTKDPEIRTTNGGHSVCTFTLAINRRIADKNGERQADFIPVVCWRALADICAKHLQKGSKVGVNGAMQTRSYKSQDGSSRQVMELIAEEVEFLDRVQRDAKNQASEDDSYPF